MVCSIGFCLRFVCSGQGGSRHLMFSSIICHLWLLGDHRGAWFSDVGSWLLFFCNTSVAARRAPTATLSALFSSLPQCACMLPVGESTVLQRLPFDDWHFTYVSELLHNDFCHRWPYYCSVIGLGVILFGLFFMMMTSLVWLLCGRNFRFLLWLVSVPVLHRSTILFPCNLGLYFLLSLARSCGSNV